jgi:hypothetical protein
MAERSPHIGTKVPITQMCASTWSGGCDMVPETTGLGWSIGSSRVLAANLTVCEGWNLRLGQEHVN